MAQLVAHHTGSVGVRGSSPLSSTKEAIFEPLTVEYVVKGWSGFACAIISGFRSAVAISSMISVCSADLTIGSPSVLSSRMRSKHAWFRSRRVASGACS